MVTNIWKKNANFNYSTFKQVKNKNTRVVAATDVLKAMIVSDVSL
jgi:hypothetical protein